MSADREGGMRDPLEGRIRDAYDSLPSGAPSDGGLAAVSRRARRIRVSRIASGAVASLVVLAAIVVPLVAFGAIGGTTTPRPGGARTGKGTLEVSQSVDQSGPMFIEGAIGFLEVRSVGRLVQRADGPMGMVHLRVALPAGTYRVVSYLRPCDGNCGYLDAPVDRCTTAADVSAGSVTKALARVTPTQGCTFAVGSDADVASPSPAFPDVAAVVCDANGTRVLTPEVRAQTDGVHIRVDNRTDADRRIFLTYANGAGGGASAPPGVTDLPNAYGGTALRIPPGPTLIRCVDPADPAGDVKNVGLEVVDPDGVWTPTSFDCPEVVTGSPLYTSDAKGQAGDPVELARQHFQGLLPTDVVELAGYADEGDPIVRVVRDGATIATIEYFQAQDGGWLEDSVSRCTDADILG
jgi:hypothetical protein